MNEQEIIQELKNQISKLEEKVKKYRPKSINEIVDEVHQNAVDHGWWDGQERSFGEIIALCHSELSEALEHHRNKDKLFNEEGINSVIFYTKMVDGKEVKSNEQHKGFKPDGIAFELADTVIRIMDYFGKKGWNLQKAIEIKHQYNKTRPYKHGGKII